MSIVANHLALLVLSATATLALGSFDVRAKQAVPASSVSTNEWDTLNKTVGGRLHTATPISVPCFSQFDNKTVAVNPMACSEVQAGYTSPPFRVSHFGAYMQPQWETCQTTSEQCLLDSGNPFNQLAFNGTFQCSQGSISPFYIDVREASDIQAAYAFSASTGVSLVIKNSGHDYKGRSSSRESLALWTHNLNTITHAATFVPEGCTESYNAVTIGAGAGWQDVYDFAEIANLTVIGGYHQTIGASGGWLMGGGHSILSPVYGLGVDRVVQMKIVTPDGKLRTANACHNSDLFWALRGGGGGTFGVLLESTQVAEEQLTLQVASIQFTQTSTNMPAFYKIVVDNSVKWGTEGWGGHVQTSSITYVTPNLSLKDAKDSMKPLTDWISTQNGTSVIETLPSWDAFFQKYVLGTQSAVGALNILGTRLIPTTNFKTESSRAAIIKLLVDMLPFAFPYVGVVTPFLHNATQSETSVTPSWRNSLWHLGFHASLLYNSTLEEKREQYRMVSNVTQSMRDIAPNSGAYFNEGDVYEPNHETAFWGANYPRLLQIKKKYDPHGLLQCWQCVGWSGPSDDRYHCYP